MGLGVKSITKASLAGKNYLKLMTKPNYNTFSFEAGKKYYNKAMKYIDVQPSSEFVKIVKREAVGFKRNFIDICELFVALVR